MFSHWYHHNPTQCAQPVEAGVWVKVYDYENNVFEGWSHEFNWEWSTSPYGNITHYCVREGNAMSLLKGIAASPPHVLISEKTP